MKPCTVDKIKTMHDAEYVDKIASVSSLSKDDLISMEHSYDGVQIHEVVYLSLALTLTASGTGAIVY